MLFENYFLFFVRLSGVELFKCDAFLAKKKKKNAIILNVYFIRGIYYINNEYMYK